MFSSYEVCDMAGITYRQLDYWIRCGYFAPEVGARGSGTQRRYTLLDASKARVMGVLSRTGPGSPLREVGAVLGDLALDRWPDHLVVVNGREAKLVEKVMGDYVSLSDIGVGGMLVDLGAVLLDLPEAVALSS